jgi:hypothetical protein
MSSHGSLRRKCRGYEWMRTTVTVPDQEEDDWFPGCGASVTEDGELWVTREDGGIEAEYAKGEWSEVYVTVE